MSKGSEVAIELLSFKSGKISLNKDTLQYLKSIEDELIIVCYVGKDTPQKNSLINSIVPNFTDNNNGIWLNSTPLQKDNSSSKILIVNCHNITDSNGNSTTPFKSILSLLFLSSTLFIICSDSGLEDHQLSQLDLFTTLPTTLEMKNKSSREAIFSECSPKSIFFISNSNVDPKTVSSRDYLDNCLRKKTEAEIDLIRDSLIRFFPDRDCLFISTSLKAKITKEISSKSIKGKKFNGPSFAFFISEWCNAINNGQSPHFDGIWDKMIQEDIDQFDHYAMNSYNEKLTAMTEIYDQDDLLKQLYEIKLDAMMAFNTIFKFNQDTFNNSEYLSWYNERKRNIEQSIEKSEKEKIESNEKESEGFCKKILLKEYAGIKGKVENGYYNSQTCDEYLKDYDRFLGSYTEKARGPEKLKMLIEFIGKTKGEFVKNFVESLDSENKIKLEEANKKLASSNKTKMEAEERFRELNEATEDNSKKIEDLNSNIEKKKREIVNLNEQIDKLDQDIRNIRQGGNNDDIGNKNPQP